MPWKRVKQWWINWTGRSEEERERMLDSAKPPSPGHQIDEHGERKPSTQPKGNPGDVTIGPN